MSDHIERVCRNCGSLLHHESRCPQIGSGSVIGSEASGNNAQERSAMKDQHSASLLLQQGVEQITRAQLLAALQHTSRVDTERILSRLGFNEQEIADAIR